MMTGIIAWLVFKDKAPVKLIGWAMFCDVIIICSLFELPVIHIISK